MRMEIIKLLKSNEIRKKRTKERHPCFVCNKHESITEVHHIIQLKDISNFFNIGIIDEITNPLVHLCPNCHSYTHKCFYGEKDKTFGEKAIIYKLMAEWGNNDLIRKNIQILKLKIEQYAINIEN